MSKRHLPVSGPAEPPVPLKFLALHAQVQELGHLLPFPAPDSIQLAQDQARIVVILHDVQWFLPGIGLASAVVLVFDFNVVFVVVGLRRLILTSGLNDELLVLFRLKLLAKWQFISSNIQSMYTRQFF